MEVETERAETYQWHGSNRRRPGSAGRQAHDGFAVSVAVYMDNGGTTGWSDKNVTTVVTATSATPTGKKSAQ